MSPSTLRSRLESINLEINSLEEELTKQESQGVIASHEIRFEVTEASESLERAIERLDQNYRGLV